MDDTASSELDPRSAVDVPKYVLGKGGQPTVVRTKKPADAELVWCSKLMLRYEEWRNLVDLQPAETISIEYACRYPDMPELPPKSAGLPRIDAVVWHGPSRCSLVEAKVATDPSRIMGGVGQLLYYKAWMERVEGYAVEALVLAAPSLPMLVLESIQDVRANIRFLKVTDSLVSGLVPRYADVGLDPEAGALRSGIPR